MTSRPQQREVDQLTLASNCLLSIYPTCTAEAAGQWRYVLGELVSSAKAGRLGQLDPLDLRRVAGFGAVDAALDRELPLDAVAVASAEASDEPLKAFVAPLWNAPIQHSPRQSSTLVTDMLDPDACHSRLAAGDPLLFLRAWRVLPGLRRLYQRLTAECELDLDLQVLLIPPSRRTQLAPGRNMAGHLMLGVADGQVDLRVLLPAASSPDVVVEPSRQRAHGMLQRTVLDGLESGHWAYAPDKPRSIEIAAGEHGAVVLLVGLTVPTWGQLARFAVLGDPTQRLSDPAHADDEPPNLIPGGSDLQRLLAARRRQLHERRADVREGRLQDILCLATITEETPLKVRADRSLYVDFRPLADRALKGLSGVAPGLPTTDRFCFTCFGRQWCVPAVLQPWVEQTLARTGAFRPVDLAPPPAGAGHRDAVAICREMVAHGLLQVES